MVDGHDIFSGIGLGSHGAKDAKPKASFLFITVSLILGIVTAAEWQVVNGSLVWGVPMAVLLVAAFICSRMKVVQSLILIPLMFILGGWLCSLRLASLLVTLPEKSVRYEAIIASQPSLSGDKLMCDLIVTSTIHPFKVRARLPYEANSAELKVGDGVSVRSRLYMPHNYPHKDGRKFDYRMFLLCKGYSATTRIYPNRIEMKRVDASNVPVTEKSMIMCLRLREQLAGYMVKAGMDENTQAVTLAMTLSDKSLIDKRLRSVYSDAGVSHILALSGLHLSIIYAFFALLLLPIGRGWMFSLAILTATWSFVFIIGMPPSAVRAAVMLTVYSLLSMCYRERMSVNVLAFTAFAMLTVSPLTVYDVSFQLSFTAVLGILLLFRPICILLNVDAIIKFKVVKWAICLLITSLSAQAATAPIVAYCFGTFPVYFLLSNIVVVPLATVILILSAILLFTSFFTHSIMAFMAQALDYVVYAQHQFLTFVSSLPCSSITGLHPTLIQVLLCYAIELTLITLIIRTTRYKRKKSMIF